MSEFSDYLENAILAQTLIAGTETLNTTPQPYLALFTEDPTDAGNGSEAYWDNYVRVPAYFNPPSGGSTSNTAEIAFVPVEGNETNVPTVITHIGIYDASTDGHLLYHSPLTNNKTLYNTDTLTFNVGSITISLN
jgi:hypothetical protein